jgi:hypothetical protein
VRLACGGVTLSEADNWYVPGRLSAAMNQELETSDTPFGKVVRPLRFQRHTVSAELLWHPLPDGWEMDAPASPPGSTSAPAATSVAASAPSRASVPARGSASSVLAIPAQVLQHRAVLTLPDGTPFSEVVETYTDGVFAFIRNSPQSSPN